MPASNTPSTGSTILVAILRTLLVVVVVAIAGFFSNAANLSPFFGTSTATAVAAVVLVLEHLYESSTGSAIFGLVKTR